MITIKFIESKEEKSRITQEIMDALPEWFSPPEETIRKSIEHQRYPFAVACHGSQVVGFAALKQHNGYTMELYTLAVLRDYHRRKIGHRLLAACIQFCRKKGIRFLTVKTLDSSAVYTPYNGTRAFYKKEGFYPLEVFTCIWDEDNPCLFLVKPIEEVNENAD